MGNAARDAVQRESVGDLAWLGFYRIRIFGKTNELRAAEGFGAP